MVEERRTRIAGIITDVLRQALADSGFATFLLPEGDRADLEWCRALCRAAGGPGAVQQVTGPSGSGEGLLVHPANKTVLLLGPVPAAHIFPLGDLYASQVHALAGADGIPAELAERVEKMGGLEGVERALQARYDQRRTVEEAEHYLPEAARGLFLEAVSAGRMARRRVGLVPKLSARTLGVDLFD